MLECLQMFDIVWWAIQYQKYSDRMENHHLCETGTSKFFGIFASTGLQKINRHKSVILRNVAQPLWRYWQTDYNHNPWESSLCVTIRSCVWARMYSCVFFVRTCCLLLKSIAGEYELSLVFVNVHWSKKNSHLEPCLLFSLLGPGHVPLSSFLHNCASVSRPWAELQHSLVWGNGLVSGLIRGRGITD